MGITFHVSDVDRVVTKLLVVSGAEQLASLGWKSPEASRLSASAIADAPRVNPLALAVDRAFAEHRPLVLGPDAVWLCLAQSLATHIELNAEELRPRLVRHRGQLDLEVRRDDFLPGDPNNDWPGAVDALAAMIKGHIGGRADLFVADFSTTTAIERTASQIALMGGMRNYFRYGVATLCGIPEITLLGTPEDWASIRRRVAVFTELDLAGWAEALDPVLAKIEETARATSPDRVDREFWRSMYKMEHESGGERAYGWLNTFFLYVGDPPRRNSFPAIGAGPFQGNKLSDFPAGRTRVPFTWRLIETRIPMELVGGLFGITQDDSGALGVVTGWVVHRAKEDSGFVRSDYGRHAAQALHPRAGVKLETLESLRHEAGDDPITLSLMWNDKLRSLDGVAHLRGLLELGASNAPLLEDISALVGMTSLRRLDLGLCPKVKGVRAVLESLPQLESLSLMRNAHLALEDFLPIAKMTNLKYLVLWDCVALPEPLRKVHQTPAEIDEARRVIASLSSRE